MADDFGIKVSDPISGGSVLTAADQQLIMTSKYPMAKLDTAKTASFQNILFTFNNNPPGGGATTTVYSYSHGYAYIPSMWALCRIRTRDAASVFDQTYFMSKGVIDQYTLGDYASFEVWVDAANVNFDVQRFGTANVTGIVLQVRVYVFVEDVGI